LELPLLSASSAVNSGFDSESSRKKNMNQEKIDIML
jgi:hypothetical protein